MALLEEVFKTNGVPTYTFVKPKEYSQLQIGLRTPGRGVVIEGPSGIGKTTAVVKAIEELGLQQKVTRLTARRPTDVEYIAVLPDVAQLGLVIIDDFHKLPDHTKHKLADYMKTLADDESAETKLVLVGINRAGENLVEFAADLNNRIEVVAFETNPESKVEELLTKGEVALNLKLNVRQEIVEASQGSFYVAQMLAQAVCLKAGIVETLLLPHNTNISFEGVRSDVWDRLQRTFGRRCEGFARGNKFRPEGRAPYLHILRLLSEGKEWTLDLKEAIRANPNLRNSLVQVVDKGYLRELIDSDEEIDAVLHYDDRSKQITVEDPQFIFFIRNLPWKEFARKLGFANVDFDRRYDFALSFAGADRVFAEALFAELIDRQFEVFYDKNEQHRIIAEDVEEYLRPIYLSEAAYVVVLLGEQYPKRVWTKIESDAFRRRLPEGEVVPIFFEDVSYSDFFDSTRKIGGLTVDKSSDLAAQMIAFGEVLSKKLVESHH